MRQTTSSPGKDCNYPCVPGRNVGRHSFCSRERNLAS